MTKTYSLYLHPEISSESAWILLQSQGAVVLYGEEEEGQERLIVKTSREVLERFNFIRQCEEIILPEIDWEAEWKLHAPGFSEGKLPIDVKGKRLYFVSGAGFGNLSHPTTRLVLELMKGQIDGKDVVDIGAGSGVLAVAAAASGAGSVVGIDIDAEANAHAAENALLNGFPEVRFYLPEKVPPLEVFSGVVLMNMITSEQKEAWKAFAKGREVKGVALTSGVLKEQEEEYRALVKEWGWRVEEVIEEDGWLGFHSVMN